MCAEKLGPCKIWIIKVMNPIKTILGEILGERECVYFGSTEPTEQHSDIEAEQHSMYSKFEIK